MFLVKFPVIVVVYVATSLVNTDEYTIYYAYDSVYKVSFNYGRCFPFVYIHACTAVFLCCRRFSVNTDVYMRIVGTHGTWLKRLSFPIVVGPGADPG